MSTSERLKKLIFLFLFLFQKHKPLLKCTIPSYIHTYPVVILSNAFYFFFIQTLIVLLTRQWTTTTTAITTTTTNQLTTSIFSHQNSSKCNDHSKTPNATYVYVLYLITTLEQQLARVASDETGSTSNQNLHDDLFAAWICFVLWAVVCVCSFDRIDSKCVSESESFFRGGCKRGVFSLGT